MSETATVLRTELYAVAALVGADVVVLGNMLNVTSSMATVAGAILCFGLRFIAMRQGWQLSVARWPIQLASETDAIDNREHQSRKH